MAPRTLSSTWRQFEKLARGVVSSDPPAERLLEQLEDLAGKANRSKVVNALQTLFVVGHPGTDAVRVNFLGGQAALAECEATRYDDAEKMILVNPVGVIRFIDQCTGCVEDVKTRQARESFKRYRLCAYQAELSKLPSHLMLFLTLLRQVGTIAEVGRADRRPSPGSGVESEEDTPYLMLLWAFKQLEAVMREVKGISIRSDYHILWYESDWITGRR